MFVGYSKHADDIPACRLALMIGSDPGNVRAYDDATTRGEERRAFLSLTTLARNLVNRPHAQVMSKAAARTIAPEEVASR